MSTYTPIASVTLDSAASSVSLGGIPQTYTDLVVVVSASQGGFDNTGLRFNDDTGSNYSKTLLYGDGSSALSVRDSNSTSMRIMIADTGVSSTVWHIMNYSNSTTYKTAICRSNIASQQVRAGVGLWRNTNAITKLTFLPETGNWASGSTFNLYGIANASITNVAKATGGDSVYTDGTYWYHTFLSSGTFTPTEALTADYLVVAGGGGGGANRAGGGGAGGFRTSIGGSALSLTSGTGYTVTVGGGGAGGAPVRNRGASGSNSVFSTITSNGGGGGGTPNTPAGVAGGSGGGGTDGGAGGAGNTPSTSPSQGNNGGTNPGGQTGNPAAGGGGAGAVGGNGSNSNAGAGGAGTASSISGTSVTYAGGGGGGIEGGYTAGAGGAGGGGAGSSTGNGNAGTANTGGGGGGSASTDAYTGGAGGSGIVIVRYAV